MNTQDCRQFHENLAEGHEASPLHLAFIESHEQECPDCALFRSRLALMDKLAEKHGSVGVQPSEDAKERLFASWQHLTVQRSWKDRFLYWHRVFFEPQVLQPLMPHAAMIVGFMFFTYSIVVLQAQTGLLTVKTDESRRQLLIAAAPAAPASVEAQIAKG